MGAGAFATKPIFELIEAYVLSADRLHGDDSALQEHTERMIVMI
ncbi:hypothetical protein ACVIHF_000639 [Bradyrhizobium sp. USDA 4506]